MSTLRYKNLNWYRRRHMFRCSQLHFMSRKHTYTCPYSCTERCLFRCCRIVQCRLSYELRRTRNSNSYGWP